MIINDTKLLQAAPIKNMIGTKETNGTVSHGLTEAGYDITIKQGISFHPAGKEAYLPVFEGKNEDGSNRIGFIRKLLTEPTIVVLDPSTNTSDMHSGTRFTLASAVEEFDMPDNLLGIVHDKSSWARKGLSVFNTCIEPGWKGYLTLELVFHGNESVYIPAGSGIAQVIFHNLVNQATYKGKYNHQADMPVPAIDQ